MTVETVRPPTTADRLLAICLAAALVGTALLVDPFSHAGFDAPKRLAALLAASVGGIVLFWPMQRPQWRRWSPAARHILALLLLVALGLLVATILSPHPQASRANLGALALLGLFLPLGAARLFDTRAARIALCMAVLGVCCNAVLSLVQASGITLPIPIAQVGGRFATGALLGNEGYVALACALMSAAALGVAMRSARGPQRAMALMLAGLGILVILVNQQVTSAVALGIALIAMIAARSGARWLLGLAAAAMLCASLGFAFLPLRGASATPLAGPGIETLQRITTYRLGAWAAAAEMIAARPFIGFGPGSYAAEAQHHRLAAEMHAQARLLPPPTASAFVHAHNDFLQLAAEAGLPTLLALLAAFGLLMARLQRLVACSPRAEPLALLGVLVAGAVAGLAWFPLQIPFTAVVLLLACGRAWRLIAEAERAP